MDKRIAHTQKALQNVVENWSHSHGTNPDGDIICVPCMAALLLDIKKMIDKDTARTSDGRLVIT